MAVELAADELERVPARIAGRLWRAGRRTQVRRYVTAMVAALERKNGRTLTWQPGEGDPDRMQRLLVRRWAWIGSDDIRCYAIEPPALGTRC